MRVTTLMSGVTTNVSGTTYSPQIRTIREGIVQTSISGGTVNVVLEGKLHPDAPWQTIVTETASNAQTVAIFPYMRASTNTISGATVSVWLQHE